MNRYTSVLFLACLAAGLACAKTPELPEQVGRIADVHGDVLIEAPGADRLELVARNWPVTSGDRIVTERDAIAEIGLGIATARLDSGADVTVVALDRTRVQLSIGAGAVSVQLRELRAAEAVEIRMPRGSVKLLQPGDYRIEPASDGTASIVVRAGEAQVDTGTSTFQQLPGEKASIAADGTVTIDRSPRPDAFDRWTQRRQRELKGEVSAQHVARGIVGYEDLDAYGDWHWERAYGMVWGPSRVPEGWAPFRQGQWILKAPWGWTWLDESPWGFAPFHYGRWVQLNAKWYWLPGPRQLPPVYAPALVRWIDHPENLDAIGWTPLGPYGEFVPFYPASERHARALNTFGRPGNGVAQVEVSPPADAVTWTARGALFRERMAKVAGSPASR